MEVVSFHCEQKSPRRNGSAGGLGSVAVVQGFLNLLGHYSVRDETRIRHSAEA